MAVQTFIVGLVAVISLIAYGECELDGGAFGAGDFALRLPGDVVAVEDVFCCGQRNALIIISDGIDNRVSKQELPSRVSIKKLVRAAAEMNTLIYPVFLRSGERFGRGWSRKGRLHMRQLAEASGGKLFPALSIRDLEPVFPQVGRELRSVYGVAYYPKNQNFDGVWRALQVKVNRPGVTVRARTGYFAR